MNAQKCGEFIAELRKENKLTQKDLAERINVSDDVVLTILLPCLTIVPAFDTVGINIVINNEKTIIYCVVSILNH